MTDMPAISKARFWLIVALIALAAMAVRIASANHSLWFDELASLYFAGQPIAKLWSPWILRETNPPLYYTMLRGWIALFGSSDVAVRIPSILAEGAAIALVARLGAKVYGPVAGLIAALFVAASAQHLFFSLQARSYIFAFCATTIGIEAILVIARRLGEKPLPIGALATYAIAASFAVYLHTTMLLFPPIAFLAVMIAGFDRVRANPLALLPLVVANLFVLLVASWWIWVTLAQVHGGGENIAANGTITISFLIQRGSGLLLARGNNGGLNYAVMALVALTTLLFAWIDRARVETRLLAIMLALTVILFAGIGLKVPIYTARTLFWMSLVPVLFTAAIIARLRAPRWIAAATVAFGAMLAANLIVTIPNLENEDWNGAIRTASVPGSIMLVASESMGVDAQIACVRIHPNCPIEIIALVDPADSADSWAKGLYPGPKMSIDAVRTLPEGRPIFLFRKEAFHHVLYELHTHGLAQRVIDNDKRIIGPLTVDDLR